MAEDKKSFLLYTDLIHTVNKMPNDKAGELFKHILAYVNDLNPETNDLIIELTFEPIKQQLKRDLIKYKEVISDKSNAGKLGNLKRWHNDLYTQVIENKISVSEALNIAENRKVSHSDNVQSQPIANVAVNDNVNVNDINIPPFHLFLAYAIEKKPNVDPEAVRLKFDSWNETNWVDGNGKKIKNWKSKLLNTLPYLKESAKNESMDMFEQRGLIESIKRQMNYPNK